MKKAIAITVAVVIIITLVIVLVVFAGGGQQSWSEGQVKNAINKLGVEHDGFEHMSLEEWHGVVLVTLRMNDDHGYGHILYFPKEDQLLPVSIMNCAMILANRGRRCSSVDEVRGFVTDMMYPAKSSHMVIDSVHDIPHKWSEESNPEAWREVVKRLKFVRPPELKAANGTEGTGVLYRCFVYQRLFGKVQEIRVVFVNGVFRSAIAYDMGVHVGDSYEIW